MIILADPRFLCKEFVNKPVAIDWDFSLFYFILTQS